MKPLALSFDEFIIFMLILYPEVTKYSFTGLINSLISIWRFMKSPPYRVCFHASIILSCFPVSIEPYMVLLMADQLTIKEYHI